MPYSLASVATTRCRNRRLFSASARVLGTTLSSSSQAARSAA